MNEPAKAEVNGNMPQGYAAMSPEMNATMALVQQLNGPVRHVVGVMVQGMLTTAPGVPSHVILNVICWQLGNIVGEALQGDMATLFSLRKAFQENFSDGVKKAKMVMPGGPPANLKG